MNTTINKYSFLTIFALILLITSCNKDKWEQTATTKVITQETEDDDFEINNGKTEIEEAQLQIDGVSVTGKRLQSDDPNITIDKQVLFDFKEGSISPELSIEIPQGNYEDLWLTLNSNSTNNFTMELDYEHPGQGQVQNQNKDYTILISFNINDIEPIQIKNKNQETSFLINTENNYQMSIRLDPQALFKGINQGMWNGMINSNNNQQNIIEINENFNYLVKKKIEQNINKSIIVELN